MIIFVSEDFDSGTPPDCWPCKYHDPPEERFCFSNERYNGWKAIDYLVDSNLVPAGRSTMQKHSGTYSFYNLRPADSFETCWIEHNTVDEAPYPTLIYVRFYVWFTSNWSHFDDPAWELDPYDSEFVHWIFLNTKTSNTGWRINILGQDWWGGSPAQYAFFRPENGGHTWEINKPDTGFNLLDHLEQWLCIEFKLDATNKLFNVWINGEKQWNQDQSDVDGWQEIANDHRLVCFSGFNSFNNLWVGDFYLDDILIADSYIGPTEGTESTKKVWS